MRALISLFTLGLGACANTPANPLPAAPKGFVLVREYVDSFKTEKGDEYRKVQIGWDYQQQVAVEKFFDMSGKSISETPMPNLTLRATEAEMSYAYALVRSHPHLRKRLSERQDVKFYGGFSLREPKGSCAQGSRCVHVIVSGGADGQENVAHAIVDLAARKVVNSKYQGRYPEGVAPNSLKQ
jgi:hypothetical protein